MAKAATTIFAYSIWQIENIAHIYVRERACIWAHVQNRTTFVQRNAISNLIQDSIVRGAYCFAREYFILSYCLSHLFARGTCICVYISCILQHTKQFKCATSPLSRMPREMNNCVRPKWKKKKKKNDFCIADFISESAWVLLPFSLIAL